MSDYKLYVDKRTDFQCKIQLEGASLQKARARLVVEADDKSLLFEGSISKNGECHIPVDKLRGLVDENSTGTVILEVIADDTYFQPWTSPFVAELSRKLRVEVASQRSAGAVRSSKPNLQVEVVGTKSADMGLMVNTMVQTLRRNGITARQRGKISKVIREYVERSHQKVNTNLLISRVVKKLTR